MTDGFADGAAEALTKPKRPQLLEEDVFMNADAPGPIVYGVLFERSTHMLNGASKAGKSVTATQLAMCVGTGSPFLGCAVAQRRVLLVSLEMNAGVVRRRMEAISQDTGIPMPKAPWFRIVAPIIGETPQINLTAADGVADLRRLVREADAQLVILDTLYRFIPGVDPSDNGQMGEVMGTLNTIASDTGAAILVIHHTRKKQGDDEGPVSHSGLGAQIIGGAANVILALQRVSKQGSGSWKLEVEGHYDHPVAPIYYTRPTREDGSVGVGCVACTASEARNITPEQAAAVFEAKGERLADGVHAFVSKGSLGEAFKSAGLLAANSNSTSDAVVSALVADFGGAELVVLSGAMPRNAHLYVWRGSAHVWPEVTSGAIRLLSGDEYAHGVTARAAADAAFASASGAAPI